MNDIVNKLFRGITTPAFIELINEPGDVLSCISHTHLDDKWKGTLFIRKPYASVYANNLNSNTNTNTNTPIVTGKIKSNNTIIRKITHTLLRKYIELLIIQSSKWFWIINKTFLKEIRFGIIIIRHSVTDKSMNGLIEYEKVLEKYNYRLLHSFNVYYNEPNNNNAKQVITIFKSKIGITPYYLGSYINGKYKLVGSFKSGMGSKGVYLLTNSSGSKYILKYCSNITNYNNEKHALLITKDWIHSPRLIYYDDMNMYIIMQYCGTEMRDFKKKYKFRVLDKIHSMVFELQHKYGIYHNDIRWKNITYHNGIYYLIDWGMASREDIDEDHQGILGKNVG